MQKLKMTGRISLGVLGGYFLAVVLSVVFSKLLIILGVVKVNATLWAQMISFLVYACLIMWVFASISLKKVSLQFLALFISSGIIIGILKVFGI